MKYDILSHEKVYSGKIFDVFKDSVELENNLIATREFVLHGGASAILPIDNDGNIIFVRQYRHPAKELILEIPAGLLEKGEEPSTCACRELQEETGFRSENITLLTKMYTAVGFSTEIIYIYLATNLIPSKQNLDQDEFVTVEKFSLTEAVAMIYSGDIKDSKTIAAILLYKDFLQKDKQ